MYTKAQGHRLAISRHIAALLVVLTVPQAAFAEQTVRTIIETGTNIVAAAIVPVLALALLSFFLGVIQFLWGSQQGGPAAQKGRSFLVWGIVVLFVITAVWGIVAIVRETFGI